MNRISLTTLTGQNISSPLSVLTYTADEDREISIQVYASGLAGGGVYKAVLTKKLGGVGTAYQSMTSGAAVSYPVTTVFMPGMGLPVKSGDVVKVYLEGLAADIAVGVEIEVFDVGGGGGEVTLADGSITADTFDGSTAYPITKSDAGATEIARTGADADTLETLSDEIAAVSAAVPSAATVADAVWDEVSTGHTSAGKAGEQLWTDVDAILADTNELQTDWHDGGRLDLLLDATALEATLTAIKGAGWTTQTLVAIDTLIDAIKAKTDLITSSTTINVTAPVVGSTISITRGDTLSADINGLSSVADYVSLDFTVKESQDDADDDAILRIRKNASGLNDGLLILNGATAASANKGSITIDNAATGDITIALSADVADDLDEATLDYDIQKISATSVTTMTYGICKVVRDVTRAVV